MSKPARPAPFPRRLYIRTQWRLYSPTTSKLSRTRHDIPAVLIASEQSRQRRLAPEGKWDAYRTPLCVQAEVIPVNAVMEHPLVNI